MPGNVRTGKGWFILDDEHPHWDPQGFQVEFDQPVHTWESGETSSEYNIPLGVKITSLKVKMKDAQSAAMWAMYTGSPITTGQVLEVRDEAQTIPATPFAVTLANADNIANTERVYDVLTGYIYKRVAAAPATGEYTIVDEVLTFVVADEARDLKITYMRTNASAGEEIIIGPTDTPSQVTFKGYLKTRNMDTGAASTQMQGIYLKKCTPMGPSTFGYEPNAEGETEWEFRVENDIAGDVTMWLEDPTYHVTP